MTCGRCFVGVMVSLMGLGLAAPSKADGEKFIEDKKKEEGVVTLASGLVYKVLKKGVGKFHPTKDSPCECHYTGTLVDGTQFDSSYDRGEPNTFAPNQVIAGWTEAMQLMVEGDKWEMYIPPALGYGDRATGPIPGGSTLVFQMEIMKIKGNKVPKTDGAQGDAPGTVTVTSTAATGKVTVTAAATPTSTGITTTPAPTEAKTDTTAEEGNAAALPRKPWSQKSNASTTTTAKAAVAAADLAARTMGITSSAVVAVLLVALA